MPRESKDQYCVIAVFAVASLHMVGPLTNASTIGGLGMVTAASPLPLVFSAHDGLDTFAQTFALNLTYEFEGCESTSRVEVDPALYRRVDGPFKRRNAYGAVRLLGPLIERSGHGHPIDDVAQSSFSEDGRLLDALGLEAGPKRVCIDSRPQNPKQDLWSYEVECR